ncbi:MAG: helix-turn-helix transcriptional regulator [Pseudobutyrivibrio sp.]|nr:helix-turn-helix transcriptional regulator [Pseudobutyrivibrio sp.]
MFDNISFEIRTSKTRLSSKKLNIEKIDTTKYSIDNLVNSTYSIAGTAYGYKLPPVSEYALNNLFYLDSFTVFNYDYASFTERQNYNMYILLYTYEGTGELIYNDSRYELTEGTGILIDGNRYHKYTATSEHWKTAVMHLNGLLLKDYYSLYSKNDNPTFNEPINSRVQSYLEEILKLYEETIPYREWHISSKINALLSYLLSLVSKTETGENTLPDNLRYLIKYMDSNYSNNLSLDDLARFANVNKYYLSREFKKYTGFSPSDYLITLRINQAKLLLQTTKLTSIQIANEVGIYDQNNFIRLFKKKTGYTPIAFRKQYITI